MVLFSIGLPSRFAEWCDAMILRLVERRIGAAESVYLNSIDELAGAVLRTRVAHLVVCCRQPVVRLQSEIIASGRPFLVALGDPRAALRDLVERAGYELAPALRVVASSCAAMLTITAAPGALVLSARDAADPAGVAAAIARHFELDADDGDIAAVVEQLAGSPPHGAVAEEDAWWDRFDEEESAMIAGALQPYVAHFDGAELGPLTWEPGLFYTPDDATPPALGAATGPVDITGRVRHLMFGPYITLSPGSWMGKIVLGFSAEAAGMSFSIEIFAGSQLAFSRLECAGEQVVEVSMPFRIDDAVDQPIQIRIANERAAFDGRAALGYVEVMPQGNVSVETRNRLTDILRR